MKLLIAFIVALLIGAATVVKAEEGDEEDSGPTEASLRESKYFGSYKPTFEPGYRPEISSDAGGFWYKVDKLEEKVKHSPSVIRDPILNNYIKELSCNLAGDYCSHIRVYIINSPHFNASMYPNGMMHIWSGLFLRAQNEAQLAAVLSHEIAHFLLSHQIVQWRKLRNNAAVAMFFDTFLTGGLATLGVLGSTMSFSRVQEAQADFYGLELMEKAGYSPYEVSNLWQQVLNESNNDTTKEKRNDFFASHPKSEQRAKELFEISNKKFGDDKQYLAKETEYIQAITPHYLAFMEEQIKLQDFDRSEFLLDRHKNLGLPQSQVNYFRAKMHALRQDNGDLEKAIELYISSVDQANAPYQAYRDLGFLLTKLKDPRAKEYLQTYLTVNPEASDKAMVDFYLNNLN